MQDTIRIGQTYTFWKEM